jgi:arylsulfatase A-like enzyme
MAQLTRREALLGLGALASGMVLPAQSGRAAEAARKPNIIFILADDLGYGDLGCYGQERVKTPHLDRMAAEGTRFTQHYSGSTVCAPSRCSLMTGLHTGHARIRGNALVPLEPEDVTVAEVLKGAGYRTALYGKWGLGEPDSPGIPTKQGFDEFYGYLNQAHAHNYYPDYLWRDEVKEPLPDNVQDPKHKGVALEGKQYSNDLIADEALKFLDRVKDTPFFLYLALTLPHANNEKFGATKDGMEVPDYGPYANEDWPGPQKGHAAMITRLDGYVGRVFEKLRALGIDDNTAVFFTSDNGTHKEGGADPEFFKSSGPLNGYKRSLHDGGIRVPMIARWPGRIPQGKTSDTVWAFWDLLPTLADIAGAAAPPCDGVSELPALLGETAPAHAPLYWEFHEGGFAQAVRDGNWKGVQPAGEKPFELYDLSTDVGERTNISTAHPDVVSGLKAFLAAARTPAPPKWP